MIHGTEEDNTNRTKCRSTSYNSFFARGKDPLFRADRVYACVSVCTRACVSACASVNVLGEVFFCGSRVFGSGTQLLSNLAADGSVKICNNTSNFHQYTQGQEEDGFVLVGWWRTMLRKPVVVALVLGLAVLPCSSAAPGSDPIGKRIPIEAVDPHIGTGAV